MEDAVSQRKHQAATATSSQMAHRILRLTRSGYIFPKVTEQLQPDRVLWMLPMIGIIPEVALTCLRKSEYNVILV